MQMMWRGDEYEFTPRTLQGGKDSFTRYSNIDGFIFGADTESVQLADRYEPQCFTCSDPWGDDDLVYIPENALALHTFLQWFVGKYGFRLLDEGKHVFLYFHNLEYDWLQLAKNDDRLLEMVKIGTGLDHDIELFRIGGFYVTLKKNGVFVGSAPHFTLRIKNGRHAFNLHFRDSFSFFPSSLDKAAKDMKLPVGKKERQLDLGQVDYRIDPGSEEKSYFEEYAKIDSRVTQMLGEIIRELHESAGMTKIRASSPGYAIALLYHGMTPDQNIMSGCWDESIMQLVFDTYRGGRTGGVYHGRVENMSVLDFHSSYPASMLSLPSFSENTAYHRLDDLSLENVKSILAETGNMFLRVSGYESDELYPSIITTQNGKLTPVCGRFENVATTGVELAVGLHSGTLQISEIHECVVLFDLDDNPPCPFRDFALRNYARKAESEKGSVEYASAKLALNSAYGKLIESRTQTLIGATNHKTHYPFIPGMEKNFGNYYYGKYITAIENGRTLDDDYDDIMQELIENFDEETREKMEIKMFGDFSISGRIYGRHVVPAAASLITATSRARLCAAMKALGALYWDTDSVFVANFEEQDAADKLRIATSWLPPNVAPLRIGEELGDLDCELTGATGWLAGTKRYYLEDELWRSNTYDENGKRLGICKTATHGIPALDRKHNEEIISFLATGKDYAYESKPKPMKVKESKSVTDIGSFKSKRYRAEFHLDTRLAWREVSGGWIGSVKPFEQLTVEGIKTDVRQMALSFFETAAASEAHAGQDRMHGDDPDDDGVED